MGAADIKLSAKEVKSLDAVLDNMEMSDVFGGSKLLPEKGVHFLLSEQIEAHL